MEKNAFAVWLQWLALLWLVSGCATTAPKPQAEPLFYNSVAERQQALASLTSWNASGRIALTTPDEGFTAAMQWKQQQRDYDVTLTVTLGQQAMRVTQTGNSATLRAYRQAPAAGVDAELLLLQELGVRVPLGQFGYWMRGLPGNLGRPVYDAAGRLQQIGYLDADGIDWTANFERYRIVNGMELPEFINISGGQFNIRLLIKTWTWQQQVAPSDQTTPPSGRLKIPTA